MIHRALTVQTKDWTGLMWDCLCRRAVARPWRGESPAESPPLHAVEDERVRALDQARRADRIAHERAELCGERLRRDRRNASDTTTAAADAAAATRSTSAGSSVSGFSQSTCLPASMARSVHSTCSAFGRDVDHVDVRISQQRLVRRHPSLDLHRAAHSRALSADRLATATTRWPAARMRGTNAP